MPMLTNFRRHILTHLSQLSKEALGFKLKYCSKYSVDMFFGRQEQFFESYYKIILIRSISNLQNSHYNPKSSQL